MSFLLINHIIVVVLIFSFKWIFHVYCFGSPTWSKKFGSPIVVKGDIRCRTWGLFFHQAGKLSHESYSSRPDWSDDWLHLTPSHTCLVGNQLSYLNRRTCHFSGIQIISHSNSISHSLSDLSVGVLILYVCLLSTVSESLNHRNSEFTLSNHQQVLEWNIGVVYGNRLLIHVIAVI